MAENLSRSLGHLEGTVAGLREEVSEIKTTIAGNSRKISEMHDVFMQAQGGIRLIIICSSISGAIGAAITWALSLWGRHG